MYGNFTADKFTAGPASREDGKSDDNFLDYSVLSKFKVFGFTRLDARVFQLLWFSTKSLYMWITGMCQPTLIVIEKNEIIKFSQNVSCSVTSIFKYMNCKKYL